MFMMDEWRNRRQPFTTSQWQELELQALIFNYMALGIPIPSHLILPFRRSFTLDLCSLHPSMSFGRKAEEDQEPWRCKRTDGKKWRCSREASGDSKYCERHKHRGKKCLTKTVEMPLFSGLAYNSCSNINSSSSSSSYTPPPLTLYSHPVNSKLSSQLDLETPYYFPVDSSKRYSKEEKQERCFVFGADLKLQKPVNVVNESMEAQSTKLQLSFFRDFPDKSNDPWTDSREECATELSISISRC